MVDVWEHRYWCCGKCDKDHTDFDEASECCSGFKTIRIPYYFVSCYGDRKSRGIPAKAPNACHHKHKTKEAAFQCGLKIYGENPRSIEEAERMKMPFKFQVTSSYTERRVRV